MRYLQHIDWTRNSTGKDRLRSLIGKLLERRLQAASCFSKSGMGKMSGKNKNVFALPCGYGYAQLFHFALGNKDISVCAGGLAWRRIPQKGSGCANLSYRTIIAWGGRLISCSLLRRLHFFYRVLPVLGFYPLQNVISKIL